MRLRAAVPLAVLLAACSPSVATDGAGERPLADTTNTTGPRTTGGAPAVEASPSPQDAADDPAEERVRFAGRISALPAGLERELRGTTWREDCPVPLEDLRLLRFNFLGFDGAVKRGPMVVHASVAEDVLWVFGRLFAEGFPMKRVGLAREFHPSRLETDPHTHRSVTASFNCRVVVTPAGPGDQFSQHSYGLAIDVNPLQNPYVREDGWVRNRFARPFVDRARDAPGMIHDGELVVRAFAAIGWAWGGHWSDGKDYMHFSLAGR
ncbi:MAG: M15 family metallopeptidase [Actinomycetota bacterium]